MGHFVVICLVALYAVVAVAAAVPDTFEEVIVMEKNSTNGEFIEKVTFRGSNRKTKNVPIQFETVSIPFRKPSSGTRRIDKKTRKGKRHRHHLRRRCCEAGDLAGKHGLSCDVSHNFNIFFMNKTTRLRMKYQGTADKIGNIRSRFRSRRVYHIYQKITKCVKQQMKRTVQKCCLAYIEKERMWKQG